jgi:hypothetical protein
VTDIFALPIGGFEMLLFRPTDDAIAQESRFVIAWDSNPREERGFHDSATFTHAVAALIRLLRSRADVKRMRMLPIILGFSFFNQSDVSRQLVHFIMKAAKASLNS